MLSIRTLVSEITNKLFRGMNVVVTDLPDNLSK